MNQRIAFAINNLGVGGAERVFVDDMNHLSRLGHEVHCILFTDEETPGALRDELMLPRERVHGMGKCRGLLDIRTFRNLRACVQGHRIDTLYATLDRATFFSLCVAMTVPRLRLVARMASMPATKAWRYRIGDHLLGIRARAIVCVSQAVADSVHHRIPGSAKRTVVLRNGVSIPTRRPFREGDPVGVLSVGSLRAQKNHALLLEAFARLTPRPRAPVLHLVGRGRLRADLERMASVLGLKDRVVFHGMIRHKDLDSVYASNAVFVLPSLGEGCPNALLEAMSYGLCCIATEVPGIRELLQHEVSGLIVPSNDPEAMARALEAVLGSESLRRRLGSAARDWVQENFSREQHARQLEALLLRHPG